eukprot:1333021-Pyramimonas_sp.AAC.1
MYTDPGPKIGPARIGVRAQLVPSDGSREQLERSPHPAPAECSHARWPPDSRPGSSAASLAPRLHETRPASRSSSLSK